MILAGRPRSSGFFLPKWPLSVKKRARNAKNHEKSGFFLLKSKADSPTY
ncbi:hypothetical protein W822_20655 [Advenella kashmirensis W13003]|uniref:Uncharacterized protein n=1 Tax=Advenella kashmirensis W13003 TaxID=1424334 RepID=V8QMS3_9BURK|nr:hypothetical protein W822_20655 [Advenella kashmirensis W13003]